VVAASTDGHWLAAVVPAAGENAGGPDRVVVWDVRGGRQQAAWDLPRLVGLPAFSDDGSLLVAQSSPTMNSYAVRIIGWDPATGRELLNLPHSHAPSVSPDGGVVLGLEESFTPGTTLGLFRWDVAGRQYDFRAVPTWRAEPDVEMLRQGVVYFPGGGLVGSHFHGTKPLIPFGPRLARLTRAAWLDRREPESSMTFFDGLTGEPRGRLAFPHDIRWHWPVGPRILATISEDGQTLQFWDVPPRKPLGLFLTVAGLLALPVALATRWRVATLLRSVANREASCA
jgi:hypothetical protein